MGQTIQVYHEFGRNLRTHTSACRYYCGRKGERGRIFEWKPFKTYADAEQWAQELGYAPRPCLRCHPDSRKPGTQAALTPAANSSTERNEYGDGSFRPAGVVDLAKIGMVEVGYWYLKPFPPTEKRDTLRAKPKLDELSDLRPAIYAHVFLGRVVYVGEAVKQTLFKRLD